MGEKETAIGSESLQNNGLEGQLSGGTLVRETERDPGTTYAIITTPSREKDLRLGVSLLCRVVRHCCDWPWKVGKVLPLRDREVVSHINQPD